MKKYTEEEWNRLSKKEKSNVKQTAAATVVALITVGIWKEFTKSGKWSVFRWWVLYFAFMGSGLFTTYREITGPYNERFEGYWRSYDDNGFAYFILITIGITIFYIYRNNFFKSRTNQKKLSTTPLIIFFFFSIAISQFGRYHISKQKVTGQKMDVYYTYPLSFFQNNNSTVYYSSENQLEESSPIPDEGGREAKNSLQESQQDIKEIIAEPSTYKEPVNPVPNYDDPGGVSENVIDISEYEEEELEVEITEYEEEEIVEEVEVVEEDLDLDVPFAIIEDVPLFPGCERVPKSQRRDCFQEKIQQHIVRNFRYPEIAQEMGIQGRVFVQFTIGKDGSISGIRTRGPDKNLEKEADRIISKLPRMTPGKQRGRPVRVPFSVPITFKLQ